MKQTSQEHNQEKKLRILSVIIAAILIAITVSSAACLTTAGTSETPDPVNNTTPVVAEPVIVTGSLEINGEPGYNVYLDGKRIGELQSPTQVFSDIEPGYHDVTVEQFGVTGTSQVFIEPDKKASVSIGLSKNQILVRMAKTLNWTRY